ncbi:hypothetical protein [Streptomyces massasporeus]|uniref:hypothetical protein n=1 Tax=Streptomyces massasporeus TaxID=67324 RepID=UPI00332D7FA8
MSETTDATKSSAGEQSIPYTGGGPFDGIPSGHRMCDEDLPTAIECEAGTSLRNGGSKHGAYLLEVEGSQGPRYVWHEGRRLS